jgi:hypothetical protein
MSKQPPISPEQTQIVKELEQHVGKSIPNVKEIEWNTVGMKVEGNIIIGLGLYNCGLTTLPESFGALQSLEKLWINGNQ